MQLDILGNLVVMFLFRVLSSSCWPSLIVTIPELLESHLCYNADHHCLYKTKFLFSQMAYIAFLAFPVDHMILCATKR